MPNKYVKEQRQQYKKLWKMYERSMRREEEHDEPSKHITKNNPLDDLDSTQWPFSLMVRDVNDYDFESYDEDIPEEMIDRKFPSEAELNKYLSQLYRDKFFQTVRGQLRQPVDEDEFKNLKRLISKAQRVSYRRHREQGLTHKQYQERKRQKFREFLDSTRPVFSYHGKPYVLDKTQKLTYEVKRLRRERRRQLNIAFAPPPFQSDDRLLTEPVPDPQ